MEKKSVVFSLIGIIILSSVSFAASLPSVGGDTNNWGTILNDYLSVSHDINGTIKNTTIKFNMLDLSTFNNSINATQLNLSNITLGTFTNDVGYLNLSAVDIGNTLANNSDLKLASQKAIKTYTDNVVALLQNNITTIQTNITSLNTSIQLNLSMFQANITNLNLSLMNLTATQRNDNTTLTLSIATKESLITAGTTLQYYRGDKTWQTLNTAAVTESTNLYWTQSRFDTALSAKTTSDLSEGTNLYFTNTRARSALSASAPITYNSVTGAIGISQSSGSTNGYLSSVDWNTFNGKQAALGYTAENAVNKNQASGYPSLDANGVIPIGQIPLISLTTNVTGTLPVTKGGTGTTTSTGTGNVVLSTNPTLVTPVIGDATATSVAIGGGNPIVKHISTSASIDIASLNQQTCSNNQVTVTGAAINDTVIATPAAVGGGIETLTLSWNAYVSTANTIQIRVCNLGTTAQDPAAQTWTIDIWKH